MEKKLYMQPALTVFTVELYTLLEGSGQGTTPNYDPNENFNDENAVGSRRRSLWDDDEEMNEELY